MKFFFKNINHYSKILPVFIIMLLLPLVFTGCGERHVESYQRIDTAMGTVIKETVYVKKGEADITGQIREKIVQLEEEMLSRRKETAEIYRVNSMAGVSQGIEVSKELWEICTQIQEISQKSDGALDITIGETVRLWNIDNYAVDDKVQIVLPPPEQVEASLKNTGYEKLQMEEGSIYLPQGMQLDLGAVGKGIACDAVLTYLQSQPQVLGAVVSVGGSILTYGEKPDGTLWKIGIIDPQDPSTYIGGLSLKGQWCVSTSGDYERYVEVEGRRFHHILDPSTGYPADAGLSSVTILSKDGAISDALSTACFVLGYEKSLALLEAYGAYGVFVDKQGNVMCSPGMETWFRKS